MVDDTCAECQGSGDTELTMLLYSLMTAAALLVVIAALMFFLRDGVFVSRGEPKRILPPDEHMSALNPQRWRDFVKSRWGMFTPVFVWNHDTRFVNRLFLPSLHSRNLLYFRLRNLRSEKARIALGFFQVFAGFRNTCNLSSSK
jgi:hypothetical protein